MSTHNTELKPSDPLLLAVQANDAGALSQGLADRFRNSTPPDTLIAEVCRMGHLDCLDVLLENGARTGPMGCLFGATPMNSAAANDRAVVIQRLVQHGVPPDQHHSTPLFDAVRTGSLAAAACLVSLGADWKKAHRSEKGHAISAFATALLSPLKNRQAMVVLLAQLGAGLVEPLQSNGYTPLHTVAMGMPLALEALLNSGLSSSIDQPDHQGMTALSLAIMGHDIGPNKDAIVVLIQQGADELHPPSHPQGTTPLELARQLNPEVLQIVETAVLRRTLSHQAVDPSVQRDRRRL